MILIKGFVFLELLVLYWLALVRNKDFFSPVKIFLIFSTFFFSAIFVVDVEWETVICYFFLIQSIALCMALEAKRAETTVRTVEFECGRLYKAIWIFSVPAVATMASFVYEAGGILQHLLSLSMRVETWKGKGHLIVLLNTLPTLNLLYFAILAGDRDKTKRKKILFGLHFLMFFCVGLLTASRSYIATPILGMFVVYSYVVRAPKLKYILSIGSALVILVTVIGIVRNNDYGGEESKDFFEDNTGTNNLANSQMAYGIMPLEIIFKADEKRPLLGGTYLTLGTNFIPRSLWPEKPDTAGVIFTRTYTEDQTGLSYMATGAVTEAVINFGKNFGLFFGVIANFSMFLIGTFFYNRKICLNKQDGKEASVLLIVAYFYIVLTFARFSYGEFTDIFQSLCFYNIMPLTVISIFARSRPKAY